MASKSAADWRRDPRAFTLTGHQRAVFELVSAIPAGRVSTYGTIGKLLGSGSQSVGTALHHNPFPPAMPCHRILKSGEPPTIGGFSGSTQGSSDGNIDRKVAILAGEGVAFDTKLRMADASRVWTSTDFPAAAVEVAKSFLDGTSRAAPKPQQVLPATTSLGKSKRGGSDADANSTAASAAAAAASAAASSDGSVSAKRGRAAGKEGSSAAANSAAAPLLLRSMLSAAGTPGAAVRQAARSGALAGHTSGLAPGYAQANLVLVPKEHALAFLTFCVRNPKPCPLLEVTDAGCWEARGVAPGSDLRTDLPAYRVWRNGVCAEEVADIRHLWPGAAASSAQPAPSSSSSAASSSSAYFGGGAAAAAAAAASIPFKSASLPSAAGSAAPPPSPDARTDWVGFLLGCSFSFEEALLAAGLPVRPLQEEKAGGGDGSGGAAAALTSTCAAAAADASASAASHQPPPHALAANPRNVPMYITNIVTAPAAPFSGPLVVSMRPMTPAQAAVATSVTGEFPRVHGRPVHTGDPSALGIVDLCAPDFGDAVSILKGEVPVFWACGVTPQEALVRARIPLAITHAPGHMFVTDVRNAALAGSAELTVPAGGGGGSSQSVTAAAVGAARGSKRK